MTPVTRSRTRDCARHPFPCPPSYPFENATAGIAVREDLQQQECDCDHRFTEPHEEGCPAEDDIVPEGCASNDVFIVEGEQERYGNKAAWEVC